MAEIYDQLKYVDIRKTKTSICSLCRYETQEIACPVNPETYDRICDELDEDDKAHYFPKLTDILADL